MKVGRVSRFVLLIACFVTLALSFGCADKKVQTEPTGQGSQVGTSGTTGGAGTSAADEAARMREQQLAEALAKAKAVLTDSKIFFDFDKFDIKPEFRDVLAQKAEILNQYNNLRVIIEGHCDERGTEEYNLALGERRARAVYEYLLLLNVNAGQLELVSYGEERPAVQGSDEAAWSQNRRAEFKVIQ